MPSEPPAAQPARRGRRLKRALAATVAGVVMIPAGLLAFFTWTAFDPPPRLALEPIGASQPKGAPPQELRILTWNIGYAGLDREADFFMDGGQMPGPRSREAVDQNLAAIRTELLRQAPDAMFLQEVDKASARTFDVDQVSTLRSAFSSYQGWYGINFKSPFVPVPVTSPIGRVHSGVLTLLEHPARAANREQLPGSYDWPVRLFHLKRCAVFAHIPSPVAGKDWVLVNVHLSAFDDGSLREQQSTYLKERMLKLHEAGHFVVLGGDWNMVLPGVARDAFAPSTTSAENLTWLQPLPDDWTPKGWTWAIDRRVPTARTNEQPYREGKNYRTVIDGFLLSPNVKLEEVKGTDLGFAHSDHQPVVARISIR